MTATLDFHVDPGLCGRCGLCADDCLNGVIALEGEDFPNIPADREGNCIDCQHCLAICPEGALSIRGRHPGASLPFPPGALPSLDQVDLLVRGRRSVRQYRDENVDPELIARLLRALEHAPTGVNCRKLTFTVIQDKDLLARFRSRVMAALVALCASGQMPEFASYLAQRVHLWSDQGRDFLFRGAPHLLLVSAPADAPTAAQDVPLTLAYFELLAQSAGLGTLWLGLLKRSLELLPELKALLDLPPDHGYYPMLFGHPAVHYARTVQRQGGARIRRVDAQWLAGGDPVQGG
jgi:nitroreductase/NAD-dependent dihydropyrimidine dehydrogenase PreA subunit